MQILLQLLTSQYDLMSCYILIGGLNGPKIDIHFASFFVESVVNRIGLWIGIGKLQKKSIDYSLALFGSVRKLSASVSLIFPLSILAWYWLILFRLCWFICHGKFDYANSWLTDWKCWFSRVWSDLLVPVFQKEDTAIQWMAQLISLLIKSAV